MTGTAGGDIVKARKPRPPRKPGGHPRAKNGEQRPESWVGGKPKVDKRSRKPHERG